MFLAAYDSKASFTYFDSRMIISLPDVEVNGCSVDEDGRLPKYNSEGCTEYVSSHFPYKRHAWWTKLHLKGFAFFCTIAW